MGRKLKQPVGKVGWRTGGERRQGKRGEAAGMEPTHPAQGSGLDPTERWANGQMSHVLTAGGEIWEPEGCPEEAG